MPDLPIASILATQNPTILGAFYLPDGAEREEFLNYFILEYGEFTPIYTDPVYLALHIKSTSTVLKYTLDKLYATLDLEYNPIENYDRAEEWNDEGGGSREYTGIAHRNYSDDDNLSYVGTQRTDAENTRTETPTGTQTETKAPHEIEHKVAADNTDTYYKSTADIEDASTTTTSFDERVDTTHDIGNSVLSFADRADNRHKEGNEHTSFTDRKDIDTSNGHHIGRIHGNIGVTTSQQMIESERQVARYSFYAEAALLYASHLLIMTN